jgi:hypothetical protein
LRSTQALKLFGIVLLRTLMEEIIVFDVTMTDKEFKRAFVNQKEAWMQDSRPAEPDLEVEGLNQSLLSRVLAMLGLA